MKNNNFNFQPKAKEEPIVNELRVEQAYEASCLFGREFLYLPMEERTKETTFNETIISEFKSSLKIMAFRDDDTFYDGSDGFGSFGGFGNIPSYNQLLHVPSKWFHEIHKIKPMEGDLIKFPHSDMIYEIAKVDTKTQQSLGTQKINDSEIFVYCLYLSTFHHYNMDKDEEIMSDDDEFAKIVMSEEQDKDKEQTTITPTPTPSTTQISIDNPFGDL